MALARKLFDEEDEELQVNRPIRFYNTDLAINHVNTQRGDIIKPSSVPRVMSNIIVIGSYNFSTRDTGIQNKKIQVVNPFLKNKPRLGLSRGGSDLQLDVARFRHDAPRIQPAASDREADNPRFVPEDIFPAILPEIDTRTKDKFLRNKKVTIQLTEPTEIENPIVRLVSLPFDLIAQLLNAIFQPSTT